MPKNFLAASTGMNAAFGIDLGGTKIEGVVLTDKQSVSPLARLRLPTESAKGYDHIIQQIEKLVRELESSSGYNCTSLGICTPGTFDPDTGIQKNSNTTCLNGRLFKYDLSTKLSVPVHMANDANCFALAEALLGVVPHHVPDARCVFGIIMGTGVGGGLVFDGQVWNGKHGIAGEWGHNYLDESGGACYCGKIGCVETILSGPALERYYASQAGSNLKLSEIVGRYRNQSDPYAIATIQRMLHFFGKAVSQIINMLDPDAIVIGGGVGNVDELYTLGREEIEKHLFNPILKTPILKPALGDSAGVFGATLL